MNIYCTYIWGSKYTTEMYSLPENISSAYPLTDSYSHLIRVTRTVSIILLAQCRKRSDHQQLRSAKSVDHMRFARVCSCSHAILLISHGDIVIDFPMYYYYFYIHKYYLILYICKQGEAIIFFVTVYSFIYIYIYGI
jgi:hypothetical protein